MNCKLNVSGCDNGTTIELEITKEEKAFLERICKLINANEAMCAPTMEVYDVQ